MTKENIIQVVQEHNKNIPCLIKIQKHQNHLHTHTHTHRSSNRAQKLLAIAGAHHLSLRPKYPGG